MYQGELYKKSVKGPLVLCVSAENIPKVLFEIVTRFGIPRVLVSNNGTQFEGSVLAEFCDKYGIELRFSPVYYPQANGQVEVMNRIIFSGLKKNMMQIGANMGAWTEELPIVLWSLRTTPSHATGETPFSLVTYKATKVVRPETYELSHVNDKPINHTWHAIKLRKYYI
ncbi:hypothetical protein LIER_26718 [Lithospermum erythrorhizon]|uniref:Integrase catalytic domain-containing protein n=1 Tax=Lithospermum erythrorhizon TaxID=34254 RepID=A0AAV3RDL4_LITER